jgi:hypothetical protein
MGKRCYMGVGRAIAAGGEFCTLVAAVVGNERLWAVREECAASLVRLLPDCGIFCALSPYLRLRIHDTVQSNVS